MKPGVMKQTKMIHEDNKNFNQVFDVLKDHWNKEFLVGMI